MYSRHLYLLLCWLIWSHCFCGPTQPAGQEAKPAASSGEQKTAKNEQAKPIEKAQEASEPKPSAQRTPPLVLAEKKLAPPKVLQMTLKGPITPSATTALVQAIEQAEQSQARALIIHLDTPGGYMKSMDDMVRHILNSKVSIITYVSPPGATSGSAGVFILYASHLAAMAPATNLGSATPVMLGTKSKGKEKGDRIPKTAGSDDSVNMKRKIFNHARAQIRGLAQYHGRNAKFAQRTITEAMNLTAREALKRGAINIVAKNVQDLLKQADGRRVRLGSQTRHKLQLSGVELVKIDRDFRQRILDLIADPALTSILMMLGVLGILIEIKSPGLIFPGVIGGISLVLGLYGVQTLALDYTALALLGLSVIFFILEFQIMSYGLLSLAGILSMLLGSLMLASSGQEFTYYSLGIVAVCALASGILLAFLAYWVSRSQNAPQMSGAEALLDEKGLSRTEVNGEQGMILIHSELWQARSPGVAIPPGRPVRILSRQGLILNVEAMEES